MKCKLLMEILDIMEKRDDTYDHHILKCILPQDEFANLLTYQEMKSLI